MQAILHFWAGCPHPAESHSCKEGTPPTSRALAKASVHRPTGHVSRPVGDLATCSPSSRRHAELAGRRVTGHSGRSELGRAVAQGRGAKIAGIHPHHGGRPSPAVADLTARELAGWPVKWSGFATLATPQAAGPLKLTPAAASGTMAVGAVHVTESATAVDVDTGRSTCRYFRTGEFLRFVAVGDRVVSQNARLLGICRNTPDGEAGDLRRRENFTSMSGT